MSKLFEGLNENQVLAVQAIDGAVQVNATAGSGKTRVLTTRIAYMLEEGIKAKNILCTTFTKKASEEMQDRLVNLINPMQLVQLTLGTTHSIAYKILLKEYEAMNHPLKGAFKKGLLVNGQQKIYADKIKNKLIKDRSIPMSVKEALRDLPTPTLMKKISFAKSGGLDISGLREQHSGDLGSPSIQAMLEFYDLYEKDKTEDGLMDMDDLLVNLVKLLKSDKELLEKYRKQYTHILVDESQDNNTLQYEFIKMIAYPQNNIFLVGDDSQSIYGFRGSRPDEFIKFTNGYKGAKLINLATNYRSNADIVDTAQRLIKHNTMRLDSPVHAHKTGDKSVFYSNYKNAGQEAEKIAEEIKTAIQEGYSYKDIAVLTRTNAQSKDIEDSMILNSFPYVVYGSVSFYERKVVKDICAYLRLAISPKDNNAFKRIFNVPGRYLGKAFMNKLEDAPSSSYMDVLSKSEVELKNYERAGVEDILIHTENLVEMNDRGASPTEMLNYILQDVGYEKYIRENADDDEDDTAMDNVYTLEYALSKHKNVSEFLDFIDKMTTEAKTSVEGVQIMSIHKSKGLEYPVVFIIGMSEGLFPHWRSIAAVQKGTNPHAIEEERRLMYVAVTRAEDKAFISSIDSYNGKDMDESRFISEMIEE